MIDIHCHLLPGVDDGSNSIQQSLEQLRIMSQAGVMQVYLTPHFMRNLFHNTQEVTSGVFKKLQQAVTESGIDIRLTAGCELFIDNHSLDIVQSEGLTLGESNYVLFETMLQRIPDDIFDQTYQLQKGGYKLIMAHPERYRTIMRNPLLVEDFLHRDIYLQLNAGSFLGRYGRNAAKTAWALLEKGQAHFIGSDNHGDHEESYQKAAYNLIRDSFSDTIAETLFCKNPAKLESGEKIEIFNHWRLPVKQKPIWVKLKEFFTGYE